MHAMLYSLVARVQDVWEEIEERVDEQRAQVLADKHRSVADLCDAAVLAWLGA